MQHYQLHYLRHYLRRLQQNLQRCLQRFRLLIQQIQLHCLPRLPVTEATEPAIEPVTEAATTSRLELVLALSVPTQ